MFFNFTFSIPEMDNMYLTVMPSALLGHDGMPLRNKLTGGPDDPVLLMDTYSLFLRQGVIPFERKLSYCPKCQIFSP